MKNRISLQLVVFITILAATCAAEMSASNLFYQNQGPVEGIFAQETESKSHLRQRQELEMDGEIMQMYPKPSHVRNRRDQVQSELCPESLKKTMMDLEAKNTIWRNMALMILHSKKREEIKNLKRELENTPIRLDEIENLENELKMTAKNAAFLLETARQKTNDTLKKLQKENEELKSTAAKTESSGVDNNAILALQTEKKTAENTLTKLQNEFDELKMKSDQIFGNSSNLKIKISDLENDFKNATTQLKSADNNLQNCENKANNYLIEKNQHESQLQFNKKDLQDKIDEMQRQIHMLNNVCCEKKQC